MSKVEMCTLCSAPLKAFRRWKCHVCGRTICNNCCHREKGLKALIRSMDQLPNVICNRCLYVRQRSQYSKEDLRPIEAEWYNTLLRRICRVSLILVDSVDIGEGLHFNNIHSSVFDVSVSDPSNSLQMLPVTLTLCNKSTVTFEMDLHSSHVNELRVAVVNPVDNRPMYLQIKYLYVSSSSPDSGSLCQSFRNESIQLDNYAHIFPAVPLPLDHSDDVEVPPAKPVSNDFVIFFGVYSILVFLLLWFSSISLFPSLQPRMRSVITGIIAYAISIGYPHCFRLSLLHLPLSRF